MTTQANQNTTTEDPNEFSQFKRLNSRVRGDENTSPVTVNVSTQCYTLSDTLHTKTMLEKNIIYCLAIATSISLLLSVCCISESFNALIPLLTHGRFTESDYIRFAQLVQPLFCVFSYIYVSISLFTKANYFKSSNATKVLFNVLWIIIQFPLLAQGFRRIFMLPRSSKLHYLSYGLIGVYIALLLLCAVLRLCITLTK